MPTDPNDKMRTPGAAARRDMDGRANRPKKSKGGICLILAVAMLGVPAGAVWGLVHMGRVVTS